METTKFIYELQTKGTLNVSKKLTWEDIEEIDLWGHIDSELQADYMIDYFEEDMIDYIDCLDHDCEINNKPINIDESLKKYPLLTTWKFTCLRKITEQELKCLQEELEGSCSDGWGEGFEQKIFNYDNGEDLINWEKNKLYSISTCDPINSHKYEY